MAEQYEGRAEVHRQVFVLSSVEPHSRKMTSQKWAKQSGLGIETLGIYKSPWSSK